MKAREKARGIEALASPMVARELLSHISSKADPVYESCLNAIYAMHLHCSDGDGPLRLMASYEQLIAKAFFGKIIPTKEQTDLAIAEMILTLAKEPTEHNFTRLQRNLNINNEQVASGEANFASTMLQMLHGLDANAHGWKVFIDDPKGRVNALKEIRSERASFILGYAWMYTCYDRLLKSGQIAPMAETEIAARTEALTKAFPQPIALYKKVLENMVNSEFNLFEDNRANFIWDILLMFNVGDHAIEGRKLYFVTSDKAIIRTASEENAKYSVLKFDEYIEYLK